MQEHKATTKPSTNGRCDCDVKRNRFYRGKQMRADEFETEQDYFVRRRRLISRSVLGWGVVNGFRLTGPLYAPAAPAPQSAPYDPPRPFQGTASPQQQSQSTTQPTPAPQLAPLTVGRGFALDRCGREVALVDDTVVDPMNTILLVRDAHGCRPSAIQGLQPGRYLLSVHYAEQRVEDAKLPFPCHCAPPEKKFFCETVVFSLLDIGKSACRCAEASCKYDCGCDARSSRCDSGIRSHSCLCEWVTNSTVPSCNQSLCEWNGYWIDPSAGVRLACVEVERSDDKCEPIVFSYIEDDCGPRRLVKSNDLLFDLIRGCDLTRIESLSWGEWHRSDDAMPWDTFQQFAGPPSGPDDDAPVKTGFSIDFSGPVDVNTVRTDCFSINVLLPSEDTGWNKVERAILEKVEVAPPNANDPPNTTRSVALWVAAAWRREVSDRAGAVGKEGAIVEFEVRGDYILDCHGQAIDANARGFALQRRPNQHVTPSGNGTPGGTLVSVFHVQGRPRPTQRS